MWPYLVPQGQIGQHGHIRSWGSKHGIFGPVGSNMCISGPGSNMCIFGPSQVKYVHIRSHRGGQNMGHTWLWSNMGIFGNHKGQNMPMFVLGQTHPYLVPQGQICACLSWVTHVYIWSRVKIWHIWPRTKYGIFGPTGSNMPYLVLGQKCGHIWS